MVTTYEPNQPILIARNWIVEIDGQSVAVPVNVVLRFVPSPTIVIDSEKLPNLVLQKERFNVSLANGAKLEAMVASFNLGTGKGSLIPARQPADVLDKGSPLKQVTFGIFNFPQMLGNQSVLSTDGTTAIPSAKIEVSGWRVELTGVLDIQDVVETLKKDSGYGLTYNGTIARSDNDTFYGGDVEPVLTALRAFLSFARGAACGIALVVGEDQDGQQAWVRWGTHHTDSWERQRSWLRKVNAADIISELFPEFWLLLKCDEANERVVLRAIDWYTQSNTSAPYIGIILTMAYLELLSTMVLQREKEDKEQRGNFIKRALEKLQIPSSLPKECVELSKAKTAWKHGPHALIGIRNDLVHSKPKLDNSSHYAIHESWNLGQWYTEMMMLSLLGYQGGYVNRLARWGSSGQVILPVPWVNGHQAT